MNVDVRKPWPIYGWITPIKTVDFPHRTVSLPQGPRVHCLAPWSSGFYGRPRPQDHLPRRSGPLRRHALVWFGGPFLLIGKAGFGFLGTTKLHFTKLGVPDTSENLGQPLVSFVLNKNSFCWPTKTSSVTVVCCIVNFSEPQGWSSGSPMAKGPIWGPGSFFEISWETCSWLVVWNMFYFSIYWE